MPKNLIGLLAASRHRATPEMDFRNYVAGAPTTGTRMTDYLVKTLTTTGNTPTTAVELASFTNVTVTLAYTEGPKVPDIYWPDYVDRVTLTLGTVVTDNTAVTRPSLNMGPAATLRSYSVDTAARTITAEINFANGIYYTTSPIPSEDGYKIFVPITLNFAPEPHFNTPLSTTTLTYTVLPFRDGQPTPLLMPAPQVVGSTWWEPVPDGAGNTWAKGGTFQAQFSGAWVSDFDADYYANTGAFPTITYTWETGETSSGPWTPVGTITRDAASPSVIPAWDIAGAPGSTIHVRILAQVVEPFTSPVCTPNVLSFFVTDQSQNPSV